MIQEFTLFFLLLLQKSRPGLVDSIRFWIPRMPRTTFRSLRQSVSISPRRGVPFTSIYKFLFSCFQVCFYNCLVLLLL